MSFVAFANVTRDAAHGALHELKLDAGIRGVWRWRSVVADMKASPGTQGDEGIVDHLEVKLGVGCGFEDVAQADLVTRLEAGAGIVLALCPGIVAYKNDFTDNRGRLALGPEGREGHLRESEDKHSHEPGHDGWGYPESADGG